MIELLGSIGWGLLAIGAITHVWHHRRLRSLLAMHLDREEVPAIALTAIETILAVSVPIALLIDSPLLPWLALVAFLLAVGFMVWIARLLLTGSSLPCACSFSDGPTSWWSLGRASCAALVGLFAFAGPGAQPEVIIATLSVGCAVAAALFVLPEALSWPSASKALMARVEAYSADQDRAGAN